ncbi:uncharacterized protein LOC142854805 [Microtus pennsylvanicus]|uniref:uncharacterized protein LOC142854805 n=1 Tax=Microtus pennsylvanicus TaxID=10058 RepID=UPI003F6C4BFA
MRERGWRRCADSGVSWQRREVEGTGAGERGQVPQSVRRSPERTGRAGRTCIRSTRRPCGLGHDSAAGPSSHVGAPGLGVGGAQRPQETRNSGSERATGGAGKSRADAQPRREAGPLNNRQESSGFCLFLCLLKIILLSRPSCPGTCSNSGVLGIKAGVLGCKRERPAWGPWLELCLLFLILLQKLFWPGSLLLDLSETVCFPSSHGNV